MDKVEFPAGRRAKWRKNKILCIHGYRQNGQTFRERTGAFRKIIKKYAELVFITAPNTVPPLESSDSAEATDSNAGKQMGWWFSRQDDYFKAQDDSDCDKGFKESLEIIEKAFREEGPFDGVLGFSQGASMVSMMCAILQQQHSECAFQFDFAILVAGFQSHSQQHSQYYTDPITMPTLHVYGDTDKVIPKDMSEALLQYFVEPRILQHPGGHFIPASGPQKKVYQQFLQEMLLKKSDPTKQ